ncbi:MAG: hypothetical protein IKP61_07410 [Spirochaetales bacterium]|nr:hypothetical protein [Spirochaetales bacterium]
MDYLNDLNDSIGQDDSDGYLALKKVRGTTRFFLRSKDGRCSYLSASNREKVSRYTQKRYHRELKKAADKEIKQLEKCLGILDYDKDGISDINEVYASLPDPLKPFVKPLSLSDDDYAARWQEGNLVVKRKRIHAEDDYHKFKTMRGDYVGSKSEAIIADRLFANDIPYHYEVAFTPEGETDASRPVFDMYGRLMGYEGLGTDPYDRDTLHPDFYVLNKRTRKTYYWEHLGRLNDPKYCVDNLNRIVRIIDAGYTIGEEILITHEDARNPLRLESIDEIIDKYLK